MIGETVGSYRVVAKISTGGMGTVYRAEHSLIGKQAAVKVLHEELCHNREIVNRFFNEAKATTTIKHPGIVEIFDFGYMESGDAYIVMEFLEGVSLARRLTDAGRIEEGEAAMIMRAVCSALAAAHAKKIVHRDLKPDNVFMVVDPEAPTGERPKILDFGIAKLADTSLGGPTSATKTGAVMGTPTYMSPEQCRGTGEVDERSDLYSIGCMFYELLTGEPPFTNMAAGELIGAHLFIEPEKPTARNANISQEAEALTMALLAKKPADRPQTARDVAQKFAELAKNHGWMAQTNPTAHRSAVRMTGNVSSEAHDATVASPHGMMVPPPAQAPSSSETPNLLIGIGKTPIPPVDTQPVASPKPTTLTSAASQSAHHDVPTPKRRTGLVVALGAAALAAGVVGFVAMKGTGTKDTRPATATEPATKPATDDTKPTPVEVAKPATGDTKPVDTKPATSDTKPVDTKPATGEIANPVDTKPATGEIAKRATGDSKPATGEIAKPATGDSKAATGTAEIKPVDTKPAVAITKPATTKPATTKPTTTKPAVATTKPATTKPATTTTTTTKPATTTTKPATPKPGQGSGKILIETDL